MIATVANTLRYVAYSGYSGNQVTIVDDCGWYHFYCHMQGFAAGIGPARRSSPPPPRSQRGSNGASPPLT